jgi:hypothetical protein
MNKQTVEEIDFDWSCLPKWANKSIALNKQGYWTCFCVVNPTMSEWTGIWEYYDEINLFPCPTIPIQFAPKNFNGTWEESLFVNPNK